jgi:3-dehydroquinate synthase
MSGAVTSVEVGLGARSYPVLVGAGLLDNAGEHVRALTGATRIPIVTDQHVAATHLPRLVKALAAAGLDAQPLVLAPGEATKDFATLQRVVEWLIDLGVSRQGLVLALGGGVIGDLAGFAASIVKRGLPYVQVPTTLLAMVDSSVGGKTAINVPAGKNLVGAFHQPVAVWADTTTLRTLPARELRAGYAEVVKYGLINDPAFFAWCETNGPRLLVGDAAATAEAVRRSVAAKAAIVAADEQERLDIRALLNLGHTFGHALEAERGYSGALLHGEAVAIGMAQAFRFSVARGLCPPGDRARVERHLATSGLAIAMPLPADRLLAHMLHDKKKTDRGLPFILVRGIGRAFIDHGVPLDAVRAFLAAEAEAVA